MILSKAEQGKLGKELADLKGALLRCPKEAKTHGLRWRLKLIQPTVVCLFVLNRQQGALSRPHAASVPEQVSVSCRLSIS